MDRAISFHEESQIFYYELGLTITQWASVENAFQHVFTSSFKTYDAALALSFNAIENFRSKLLVAEAAFSVNLNKAQYFEWQGLYNKLRKRSQRRNQLAHRFVLNRPLEKPGRRIVLLEKHSWSDPIGVRDMVLLRYAFFGLSNQLLNFADRIIGAKSPFSVPHGSLERPPRLDVLLAQMREDTSPPHRPLRG